LLIDNLGILDIIVFYLKYIEKFIELIYPQFEIFRTECFLQSVIDGDLQEIERQLNLDFSDINATNELGFTALHCAAIKGHENIVTFLLSKNAYAQPVNNIGNVPMHLSASRGHIAITRKFIDTGMNVNVSNNLGFTPLFYAAQFGHDATIDLLLRSGTKVQGNYERLYASLNELQDRLVKQKKWVEMLDNSMPNDLTEQVTEKDVLKILNIAISKVNTIKKGINKHTYLENSNLLRVLLLRGVVRFEKNIDQPRTFSFFTNSVNDHLEIQMIVDTKSKKATYNAEYPKGSDKDENFIIGKGCFGTAKRAFRFDIPTRFELLVGKALAKDQRNNRDNAFLSLVQAKISLKINHPNVIRTMSGAIRAPHCNHWRHTIYGERYDGDLHQLLNRNKLKISQKNVYRMIQDIFKALKSIHNAGFIHKDIKPENIFFRFDSNSEEYRLIVGDLGLTSHENKKIVGTPVFMSPRMLHDVKKYLANDNRYKHICEFISQVKSPTILFGRNIGIRHLAVNDIEKNTIKYNGEFRGNTAEDDYWAAGLIAYRLLFDEYPENRDDVAFRNNLAEHRWLIDILSENPKRLDEKLFSKCFEKCMNTDRLVFDKTILFRQITSQTALTVLNNKKVKDSRNNLSGSNVTPS